MRRKFLIYTLLYCFSTPLFAQQNDSILIQDSLTTLDIFPLHLAEEEEQVLSVFGKNEKISELPYTSYIITEEEIKDNNYVTLTDALRTVPGIFVSPLGSAMEGELFMMHGLRGNRYAEIMINGMPIKPLMTPGMPLGAQLPIRQAERIEIVYGPGTGQFTSGANAGLINIVLKESDRPIFMQANLGAGDERYNSVDVFFGGKLNRGKNILKFSAWGSTTSFSDWRFGYPPNASVVGRSSLFRSEAYDMYYGDKRYVDAFNYSGTPNTANKRNFPHQSKNLGIQFKYRKMEFLADFSTRRDHSALGLNPLTVAYNDPIDFYSEGITRIAFKKKQGDKKLKYGVDLSFMLYNLDPFSSFQPIQSHVGRAYELNDIRRLENTGEVITQSIQDSIYASNQALNLQGNRFRVANSIQTTLWNKLDYEFSKHYHVSLNINTSNATGLAELSYMPDPSTNGNSLFEENNIVRNNAYYNRVFQDITLDFSLLLNNYLQFGKFSAIIGLKAIPRFQGSKLHPNLHFNYHPDSNLSIYFNYQSDSHIPSRYYRQSTFWFNTSINSSPVVSRFQISNDYPSTNTHIAELGIYSKIGNSTKIQLNYFFNRTRNLLRYDTNIFQSTSLGNNITIYKTGYKTSQNNYQIMHGIQGQIFTRELLGIKRLGSKFSFMLYKGSEHIPEENNRKIDQIVEYPPLILQWRLSYKLGKKWKIITENIYQANSRSAAHEGVINPGGLITDLGFRYQLSRNFEIYTKASNLFGTRYGGISALEFQDALLYNQQPLARLRFGVNYDLD